MTMHRDILLLARISSVGANEIGCCTTSLLQHYFSYICDGLKKKFDLQSGSQRHGNFYIKLVACFPIPKYLCNVIS